MQVIDGLNDAQRRAVTGGDGTILIVAGPGTGKTKTLAARIIWLISNRRADPDEILALTFTNKAAREMRDRVESLLDRKAKVPRITTFHALGAEILKQHGSVSTLVDERQRAEITRGLPKPASLKGMSARELSLLVSNAKTSFGSSRSRPVRPAGKTGRLESGKKGATIDDASKLLLSYENALTELGLHDFDDLLINSYELLKTDAGKRPDYKYVLVDEFQDTNELQYELLKLLTRMQNIFAIGDPNQSIYSFRGAGAEMFACFREDFPSTREIDLAVNYRSKPEIIKLANAVFPNAPQLEASNGGIGALKTVQTLNEYSEAAYILNMIEQGIGGSDMLKTSGHTDMNEPRDYAVLYRTHRAALAVKRAFAEAGTPYQIAGEGSPYEHPGIQEVIALMRTLHSPPPDIKAELVKYQKSGNKSDDIINTLLVKYQNTADETVCDLAKEIADTLGLDRADVFEQFLGSLVQYGTCRTGLQLFLDNFDSLSESEFYDPNVNAVTLLTIHAAKGLEFNHVFLVGAEEGILPKLAASHNIDVDEEHRMFYVAVTRAKENLEILHAKTRAGKPAELSRFVTGIPESILPRTADPNLDQLERRAKKRRQKRAQSSLF